jgi:hypothetical protein
VRAAGFSLLLAAAKMLNTNAKMPKMKLKRCCGVRGKNASNAAPIGEFVIMYISVSQQ